MARVETVRDTHFGTALEDPYRWMEQEGEELNRWLEGQAGYARSVLDAMPRRASLLARIRSLSGVLPQISDLRTGRRADLLPVARGGRARSRADGARPGQRARSTRTGKGAVRPR